MRQRDFRWAMHEAVPMAALLWAIAAVGIAVLWLLTSVAGVPAETIAGVACAPEMSKKRTLAVAGVPVELSVTLRFELAGLLAEYQI